LLRLALVALASLVLIVLPGSLALTSCAAPLTPDLEATPSSRTLSSGETSQIRVTRRFSGGVVEDVTSRVTYTTTDRAVVAVSAAGLITAGTQAGSALVKAVDDRSDATVAVSVTVVAARITSIEVTPTPATVMQRGTTQQFRAMGIYSSGVQRDVTAEVSWSSLNVAAAVVGDTPLDKGVVRAVADGDTTILATDGATRVQGRSLVFVTGSAPQLQALVVTPNPGVVAVTKTTPYAALGVFSDGTSRDMTREVTWASSRVDLATVDAVGVVTGVAIGDTTISATGPEPSTSVRGSAAAKVVP